MRRLIPGKLENAFSVDFSGNPPRSAIAAAATALDKL